MPALKNYRQERFCQLVKQGIPPYRAYPMAGYKPDDGAPYRLAGNVRVKQRMSELTKHFRAQAGVSVQSLTDELNAIAEGAAKAEQWSAAKGAVETKAKLHGLLIDRKEQGAPGDFEGLQTREEIEAKIRAEMGEEAAQLFAKAMEVPRKPEQVEPVYERAGPNAPGSESVN
jgi:hypothetical protein